EQVVAGITTARLLSSAPPCSAPLTRCRPPQGRSHWSACQLCKTPLWPRTARGRRGDPRQDQSVGVGQLPLIRIDYICFLKGLYRECRKSSSIQTVVQGQKAATIRRCMSSNQEVCKNTTRPHIALLTPTFCVG